MGPIVQRVFIVVTKCGPRDYSSGRVPWAALSISGMKGLQLPRRAGELIVVTDSYDEGAGTAAGNTLARRAHALGWQVSLMPAPEGQDWNDGIKNEAAA